MIKFKEFQTIQLYSMKLDKLQSEIGKGLGHVKQTIGDKGRILCKFVNGFQFIESLDSEFNLNYLCWHFFWSREE